MDNIIKTKLSEKEFIKINFLLLYKNKSLKIFMIILLFMSIIPMFLLLTNDPLNSELKISFKPNLFLILFVILFNSFFYYTAKKRFLGNSIASETIEYQFDEVNFYSKGESFSSQFSWSKIYKVENLKNWILIYHSEVQMNIINKKDISEKNYQLLKDIAFKNNVTNNL